MVFQILSSLEIIKRMCLEICKLSVTVVKKFPVIFCTQFGAQNAGNHISELPDFKHFWGSMPAFMKVPIRPLVDTVDYST